MIRGLKFYFPFLLPLLLAVTFTSYLVFVESPECTYLFGLSVSLLALLQFCYLLPATLFVGSLYLLYFSYKSVGHDSYPLPNTPWIGLLKLRSGWQAKLSRYFGFILPIFFVWLLWLGNTSFDAIAKGRTISEMAVAISASC